MDQRTGDVRIEAIYGPMFSGKTGELLRRIKDAVHAGLKCQAFKHGLDERYSTNEIVSHDDERWPCTTVFTAAQLLQRVHFDAAVITVDEVQFFKDERQLLVAARTLARRGQRVILSGLDMDYLKQPFEWMLLLDQDFDVSHKFAICTECGRPAQFTQRVITQEQLPYTDERIVVGGLELYEPRCADCHRGSVQVNVLATRGPHAGKIEEGTT